VSLGSLSFFLAFNFRFNDSEEKSATFGNYECSDEVNFALARGHDTYVDNIKVYDKIIDLI